MLPAGLSRLPSWLQPSSRRLIIRLRRLPTRQPCRRSGKSEPISLLRLIFSFPRSPWERASRRSASFCLTLRSTDFARRQIRKIPKRRQVAALQIWSAGTRPSFRNLGRRRKRIRHWMHVVCADLSCPVCRPHELCDALSFRVSRVGQRSDSDRNPRIWLLERAGRYINL